MEDLLLFPIEDEATAAPEAPLAPGEAGGTTSPDASPRAEAIRLIREDLLERGEHFVFQRKEGRLGWEDALPEGSAYSEAVLSATDIEQALTNAYRHATSTLTAMDLPVHVNVTIDSREESGCTDGETVCVSTKMFDDDSLSLGQKIDVFTGLTVHEGCHVLYTDFVKSKSDESRLLHSLWNIIEDERIERKCGYDTPGLANFLRMAKYYFFGRVNTLEMPDTRPERLLNTILAYVRYPAAMQDRDIEEFCDVMLQVREILTPYPETNMDARNAARRIYELIRGEVEKERKKDEGKGATGGDSDGKGKEKESRSGSGKSSSENSSGDSQSGRDSGSESAESTEEGKCLPSDKAIAEDATDEPCTGCKLSDSEVADILEALGDHVSHLTRDSRHMDSENECDAIRKDRVVARVAMGEVERGDKKQTLCFHSTLNADTRRNYSDSLNRVRHLIPAVRRALVCNAEERIQPLNGLRHGKLDTGRLAEGYQGSPTVYSSTYRREGEKLAVCVLVDESGSMDFGARIAMARDGAVLLNEALSGIPGIEYFIYGHSADNHGRRGSVEISIYKEGRMKTNRFLAGNIHTQYNNADGYAIEEVARRVRKLTDSKCLMIVLSDGEPAAHVYHGCSGVRHTAEVVKAVTAQGFIPIQVSIQTSTDPSTMFQHYIKVDDLETLPKTLGAIVKKVALGKHGKEA